MAERVGFEPTVGCPTHAFQACAFDRSAISPGIGRRGRRRRASNGREASTTGSKIAQPLDPAYEFRHSTLPDRPTSPRKACAHIDRETAWARVRIRLQTSDVKGPRPARSDHRRSPRLRHTPPASALSRPSPLTRIFCDV